jgi:bacterioferritin-associated ferredoxin
VQCKNVKSPKIQHIFEHNQLRNLNLGFIEDISDEAFMLLPSSSTSVYPTCPLQKLNLCKSKITDSSIFKMSCLIALLEIRLQWCTGITDKGVRSLVRSCPKLRLLDLKSCAVTDASLQSISELCSELRELDLSWCPGFSETGLLQLVPALHSSGEVTGAKRLERLCLEWCLQITDRTLRALHAVPTLKTVQLAGCAGVTADGVEWLRHTGRVVES